MIYSFAPYSCYCVFRVCSKYCANAYLNNLQSATKSHIFKHLDLKHCRQKRIFLRTKPALDRLLSESGTLRCPKKCHLNWATYITTSSCPVYVEVRLNVAPTNCIIHRPDFELIRNFPINFYHGKQSSYEGNKKFMYKTLFIKIDFVYPNCCRRDTPCDPIRC